MEWIHLICMLASLGLWIRYSYYEGIREARYYYLISAPELENVRNGIRWLKSHNQHPIFTMQRSIVYSMVVFIKSFYMIWWRNSYGLSETILLLLGIFALPMFVFVVIHDGMYYKEYHRLSVENYESGFWSESTTSTARMEFGKSTRILFLCIAVSLVCLELIIILGHVFNIH